MRQQLEDGVKPRSKPGHTLLQVRTVSPQRPQLGLTGRGSDQSDPALSPPLATVLLGLCRAKGLSCLPQGPPVQTCPLRGQNQRKERMLQCIINVVSTKKKWGVSFSPFFCVYSGQDAKIYITRNYHQRHLGHFYCIIDSAPICVQSSFVIPNRKLHGSFL